MPYSPSAPPIDEDFYSHSQLERLSEVPKDTIAADEIIARRMAFEESEGYRCTQRSSDVVATTIPPGISAEIEEGIRNLPCEVAWFLATAANEGIDLRRSYKRRLFCKASVVTLYLGSSSSGKVFIFSPANLRDAGFVYTKSFTSFSFQDIESAAPVVNYERI
jgi:hypothetical protein